MTTVPLYQAILSISAFKRIGGALLWASLFRTPDRSDQGLGHSPNQRFRGWPAQKICGFRRVWGVSGFGFEVALASHDLLAL